MKIAHINLGDARVGISNSVRVLMDEQKARGDQALLYTPQRFSQDAEVQLIQNSTPLFEQAIHSFEVQAGINGFSASNVLDLWQAPHFLESELVHLHLTSSAFFSYLLLPALAAKPLVWSVYEAQPYTAGCSHTFMCQNWQSQSCANCPLLPPEQRSRGAELFALKKAIYGLTPMAVVTANGWLSSQVRNSILSARFAAEIVPALEPVFFQRVEQQLVRQRLNIDKSAFVIAYSVPGGIDHPLGGGSYVRQVLEAWQSENQEVVLLQIGGADNERPLPLVFERRVVAHDLPPEQRSAALQAADLFLHLSPHDATGISLLEASAAGIPAIGFPVASGTQIRHLETGYLTSSNSVSDLLKAILFLRRNSGLRKQLGKGAAVWATSKHRAPLVAEAYHSLYERLLAQGGREWNKSVNKKEMPLLPPSGGDISELWEKLDIPRIVGHASIQGLDGLWQEIESCCNAYAADRKRERGVFVDLCMTYVLTNVCKEFSPALLGEIVDQWLKLRQLPQMCGDFSPLEKQALQAWTRVLRQRLTRFFQTMQEQQFAHMSRFQQGRLVELWRNLFFNDFTTPYLEEDEHVESRRQIEATTSPKRLYPDLLIRSMFTPYPPETVKLDMAMLVKKDMPLAIQSILAFWIVNVPFSDGDEQRQRIMRRNATDYLRSVLQNSTGLEVALYVMVVSHFVVQFWRAAYIGGNLVKEISLFGDFIYQQMKHQFPNLIEPIPAKARQEGRRLRIGYVSSNFCHQAVSYYMANRIFFADKQKFEIFVFNLEKRHDSMTDRIKSYSDQYVSFRDITIHNLAEVAETIKNSGLDLLVFADIGMEPVNYQLGAMRLAPVQCVMVGHGATTGLPTIDYYLSGDFEAPEAQEHYREQLVRLPNLGAAQLPPMNPPSGRLQRKDFGLPEDKVLLVSCANGIKHGQERDRLLVKILQQAPEAVIVLKPFMTPEMVQPQWSRRVMAAARSGGVADRLLIIPPLAHGRDLMDFLAMADIQLDSYPYGGWTTNMEAVYAGLAIVTQEGDQARSRWGAHILRALGITAGIAANDEAYVEQAVTLVNNYELRKHVRQCIKERAVATLFNGPAAQPAYEAELLRISERSLTLTTQAVQP